MEAKKIIILVYLSGGLEKSKLQVIFLQLLVIKTLDPDSLEMQDPDPDPQHWFCLENLSVMPLEEFLAATSCDTVFFNNSRVVFGNHRSYNSQFKSPRSWAQCLDFYIDNGNGVCLGD
jgi:hypothetical protein